MTTPNTPDVPCQVWLARGRDCKCDIAWAASKEAAMRLCADLNPGWRPFAVRDVSALIEEAA